MPGKVPGGKSRLTQKRKGISKCLTNRKGCARFADALRVYADLLWIIVTRQDVFEDSFVLPVMWPWGFCRTTLTFYNALGSI